MTQIKICGLGRLQDARLAQQLGAWGLGFIFYDKSPRCISPEAAHKILQALGPRNSKAFGVFVNASLEEIERTVALCKLDGVQLHGDESPDFCRDLRKALPTAEIIKAFPAHSIAQISLFESYDSVNSILVDTAGKATGEKIRGGSGVANDFQLCTEMRKQLGKPLIVAGGIGVENLREALQTRAFAVDVSSRIEDSPGVKNPELMKQLFEIFAQNRNFT